MNLLRLTVALLFVTFGLVIGFLNDSPVIVLDLLFVSWSTTPGNAIILALVIGVVSGGLLVFAGAVLPLYARLRRATGQASARVQRPSHPEV